MFEDIIKARKQNLTDEEGYILLGGWIAKKKEKRSKERKGEKSRVSSSHPLLGAPSASQNHLKVNSNGRRIW